MNFGHFVIFAAWSAFMIVVTAIVLFIFTFGDCFDEADCVSATNRNFWIIIGSAFVVYWVVAIALFRRWSR